MMRDSCQASTMVKQCKMGRQDAAYVVETENEEAVEEGLGASPHPSPTWIEPKRLLVASRGDAERRISVRKKQEDAATGGNTARNRVPRPQAAKGAKRLGDRLKPTRWVACGLQRIRRTGHSGSAATSYAAVHFLRS